MSEDELLRIETLETRIAGLEIVFAEIMRQAFLSLPDGNARLQDAIAMARDVIRTPSGCSDHVFRYVVETRLRELEKPPANH